MLSFEVVKNILINNGIITLNDEKHPQVPNKFRDQFEHFLGEACIQEIEGKPYFNLLLDDRTFTPESVDQFVISLFNLNVEEGKANAPRAPERAAQQPMVQPVENIFVKTLKEKLGDRIHFLDSKKIEDIANRLQGFLGLTFFSKNDKEKYDKISGARFNNGFLQALRDMDDLAKGTVEIFIRKTISAQYFTELANTRLNEFIQRVEVKQNPPPTPRQEVKRNPAPPAPTPRQEVKRNPAPPAPTPRQEVKRNPAPPAPRQEVKQNPQPQRHGLYPPQRPVNQQILNEMEAFLFLFLQAKPNLGRKKNANPERKEEKKEEDGATKVLQKITLLENDGMDDLRCPITMAIITGKVAAVLKSNGEFTFYDEKSLRDHMSRSMEDPTTKEPLKENENLFFNYTDIYRDNLLTQLKEKHGINIADGFAKKMKWTTLPSFSRSEPRA